MVIWNYEQIVIDGFLLLGANPNKSIRGVSVLTLSIGMLRLWHISSERVW